MDEQTDITEQIFCDIKLPDRQTNGTSKSLINVLYIPTEH